MRSPVGGLWLGKPANTQWVMDFFYPYILQSEPNPDPFYTGLTEDLHARLKKHNEGGVPHTAKSRPWNIKTAVAFTDRQRAMDFEQYLKAASGRANLPGALSGGSL